jgi:hypothetical protein
VAQTYRGSRRYQIAQYRLATVLPASLRSCHTRLICRACDCKASQIGAFFMEIELPLPCNEASFRMPVAWRHRCRVRRWPQMMTPYRHHFPNESRRNSTPDGCSGISAPLKIPSTRLKFRRDCGCFWWNAVIDSKCDSLLQGMPERRPVRRCVHSRSRNINLCRSPMVLVWQRFA